jgi:hypothetical protein
MRVALVGFLSLVSCSEAPNLTVLEDYRVVTTPGGSCGLWEETKSNPRTIIEVQATCGEGLSCVGLAYVHYQPADTNGRNFSTCLPANALICGPSMPCPAPFGCDVGNGHSGACVHNCTTHADCPDTYQLCLSTCTVLPCDSTDAGGDTGCNAGTHCQDRICRPD